MGAREGLRRWPTVLTATCMVAWNFGCQSPEGDQPESEIDGEVSGEVLEAPGDPAVPVPTSVSAGAVEFRLGRAAAIAVAWAGGPADTPTFTIERSTNRRNWSRMATTYGYSFTDTTASRGKRYYYRVKAHDTQRTSSPSSTVSAQVPSATGFRKAVLDVPLSSYRRASSSQAVNVSFVAPSGTRVYAGFFGTDTEWIFQIATETQVVCEAITNAQGTTSGCNFDLVAQVSGRTKADYQRFSALLMAPFVRDTPTITGVRDVYDRTFGKQVEPRVRLACVSLCERLWDSFNSGWSTLTSWYCGALGVACDKGFREILEIQTLAGCAAQCDECLDQWISYCANPNYRGPGGRVEPAGYCFDYAEGCRGGRVILKGGRVLID